MPSAWGALAKGHLSDHPRPPGSGRRMVIRLIWYAPALVVVLGYCWTRPNGPPELPADNGPTLRVAAANVPVPRAEILEDQAIPNEGRIMAACRKVVS